MEVNSFDDWLKKSSKLEEDSLKGSEADNYADKKGIDVKVIPPKKKSELASGGPIDSNMIDIVADLESATGFQFKVTSGNDKFHQGISSYTSNHTTGKAIDIVSPELESRENRIKLERAIIDLIKSGKYNKNGLRLGAINEYDRASIKSTGGHFHLSLTPDTEDRDRKEFTFPLLGISSYAQIRDNVRTSTHDDLKYDSSPVQFKSYNNNNKESKYYKVYDKENRRMLIAKYKGDNLFKIYNRKRDKIGKVKKVGDIISFNGDDITSTELGIAFNSLFKTLSSEKFNTPNDRDDLDRDTDGGNISHRYTGIQADNIKLIEQSAAKYGITNPNSIIGILSVIGKESQFIPKSEVGYSNTDNNRLRSIFKSKIGNMSDEELNTLKSNDEAFFNKVYGGRYGNGPNDGYKYRGRGFNQITFKGTYEKYSKLLGKDLINNPDLLNNPSVAADAAVMFLLNRLKEKNIDPNSFNSPEDAIIKYASANAGWDKDPSDAIANAEKIKPNFSIA